MNTFLLDPSPIIALPCQSVSPPLLVLNFARIVGSVKVVTLISLTFFVSMYNLIIIKGNKCKDMILLLPWLQLRQCYMDLLKLLHGCVKVVLCISIPLPNKTKLNGLTKISNLVEASVLN